MVNKIETLKWNEGYWLAFLILSLQFLTIYKIDKDIISITLASIIFIVAEVTLYYPRIRLVKHKGGQNK